MSKYEYTTVYEQFTGLKPPEPSTAKVKRKRGYGHPYRMRLNAQDEDQLFEEGRCHVENSEKGALKETLCPSSQVFCESISQNNYLYEGKTQKSNNTTVTYKKRRFYTASIIRTHRRD